MICIGKLTDMLPV